jgi:hypothetical protein
MWEIRRSRLIAGLNLLDLVPEKVGLSSSEFVRIVGKGDTITLSVASYIMGEITLVGKGSWHGEYYIDRRVFLPFVYASKELKNKNTFKFEARKRQLIVRHGTRKATLDSQKDVSGYGSLKSVMKHKAVEIPVTEDLQELLKCGANCAVSDSIVPHLNCVYVAKGSAAVKAYAASDKVFYVGMGDTKKGKVKSSIPFPLFLITLLQEPSLKNISWRGKYIVLEFEKGIIWQSISEEALKKFPLKEIRTHASRATAKAISFVVSGRRFSKMMLRLGYYLQAVRRRDWVVKIIGSKGSSTLGVSTNIPGVRFDEKISTHDKLKRDVKVEWPLDVLEPVFAFLATKTKKLGMIVRMDEKHGVSYVTVGNYWLAVTSKKES